MKVTSCASYHKRLDDSMMIAKDGIWQRDLMDSKLNIGPCSIVLYIGDIYHLLFTSHKYQYAMYQYFLPTYYVFEDGGI